MTQASSNMEHDTAHLFPIRTVCSVTGINPVTLRAWERRYGLIKPQRTQKGHRLYTQADIDLINETVRLLDKGIPIGQVRQVIKGREEDQTSSEKVDEHWSSYIDNMINAIALFDEERLDAIYNEALSLYPVDTVMRWLIIPLLRKLGLRWETGEGNVAEEHFFGVFMRNKLGARFHHLRTQLHGPKLLVACLPHEHHELGLLLFSLMARSFGYEIVMLGPNMPLDDLPVTVKRAHCDAIVLAGSVAYDYKQIAADLKQLLGKVSVPVFVGGNYSVTARDVITGAGAIPLGEEITQALKQIKRVLNSA
jgi:DNA-binding transcriptional MerR regulator